MTVEKTDQQENAIQKPAVVLKYNNAMGAVDKVDQVLEPYAVQRKGVKWYSDSCSATPISY